MKTLLRGLATGGALALALARPSHAQEQPPPGQAIPDAAPVPRGVAVSNCLELDWPDPAAALSGRRLSMGCEVGESGQLPTTGQTTWWWALYRHLSVWGPDEATSPAAADLFPDSIPEDELVLFVGGPGDEQVRPVWHDRVETTYELLRPPRARLTENPDSSIALPVHRRCLNGTGGCLDHPFRVTGQGRVQALRPGFRDQIRSRLAGEWGMWKGSWIDPIAMRAEAAAYLPFDANCCSSLFATATVAIEGDDLIADSILVEPVPDREVWGVSPGTRFGPITPTTSEEDLRARFGASSVLPASVEITEGFCTPGSRVFPDRSFEIQVAWADSARTRPAWVRTAGALSGNREATPAWRTPMGVGVGTTLQELERLRGEPVTFNGFGWDYGGGSAWDEEGGTLGLQLVIDVESSQRLTEIAQRDARVSEIMGDREVRSDHPIVRQVGIVVERITLGWGTAFQEFDCEGRSR